MVKIFRDYKATSKAQLMYNKVKTQQLKKL